MEHKVILPEVAQDSLRNLLVSCGVTSGQKILIIADGEKTYGQEKLSDSEVIYWLQEEIEAMGSKVDIYWYEEKFFLDDWVMPDSLKEAMLKADIVLNHSFYLSTTDLGDMRYFLEYTDFAKGSKHVKNMATTVALLNSDWAQTPYELLMEIRYQIALKFHPGDTFSIDDPLGTHIEGIIGEPPHPTDNKEAPYAEKKRGNMYQFWPEWMHKPVHIEHVNGRYVYDCMCPFWAKFIGIPAYFEDPIELTIENSRIVDIKGDKEAKALAAYLKMIKDKLNEDAYNVNVVHSGIHPQAYVSKIECPNYDLRRQIEHACTQNLHIHIGADSPSPPYKYLLQHCTADLRHPSFRVGDYLLHDKGHLTVLDSPEVLAVAAKYPGKPGPLHELD